MLQEYRFVLIGYLPVLHAPFHALEFKVCFAGKLMF